MQNNKHGMRLRAVKKRFQSILARLRYKAFDLSFRALSYLFSDLFLAKIHQAVDDHVRKAVSTGVASGVARRLADEGFMCCALCPTRFGLKRVGDRYGCGANSLSDKAHWQLLCRQDEAAERERERERLQAVGA